MQNRLSESFPSVLAEKATVVQITPAHTERLSPWPLAASDISFFHYHNALEIGYCFHGGGIHYSTVGRYAFSAGDALIMLPEQRHLASSHLDTDTKWIFTYVDLDELMGACRMETLLRHELFHRPITLYDLIDRGKYPAVADAVLRFVEAYRAFTPHRLETLAILCAEILLKISETDGGLPGCQLFASPVKGRLDPALSRIQTEMNSGKIPQIEDLAADSFMSVSNFRKVFRETMGIAPHSYIMEQVMRNAQRLLRDASQTILSVSIELGFQSISTFNRNFKQICGMTPDAYRRTHADLY